MIRSLVLCAVVLLHTGCATILTGTRQRVTIESAPSETLTVAVGGAVGQVVRYAKQGDEVTRFVLQQLRPHLTDTQRAQLEVLDLGELVARIAMAGRTQYEAAELSDLRTALAHVPRPVLEKVYEKLGVAAIDFTPIEVELEKGGPYSVIAWRPGHKATLATIDAHFNWTVLLNVFTLGLGVPIDIWTGAWMNLSPKVELELEPSAAAAR